MIYSPLSARQLYHEAFTALFQSDLKCLTYNSNVRYSTRPLFRHVRLANTGKLLADGFIHWHFVCQATLQAATYPRNTRGIERQPLVLGHAHRDGGKLRQKRGTTQGATAHPIATKGFSLITHANLAHLDTRL